MIGTMLSHYRILERIGSGGMGVVYRARDERLQRDVAIKVLPAETLRDPESRRRFRREALSLSRLSHPRIGTIHDFDSCDGVDFLVMELVPGTTLVARLRQGRLSPEESVAIGIQIAEALQAAHDSGVVHRDLKPANVLLTPRGDVKVVDFGLARRTPDLEGSTETLTSEKVVGTLPYVAPEVLGEASEAGARVDIWAFGVILYEIVTGVRPFPETDSMRLVSSILQRNPPRPRTLRKDVPAWLEAVILTCLEKDPGRRYSSAGALLEDLKRSQASRSRVRIRPLRLIGTGLLLLALIGGVWSVMQLGCERARIESIAVLPLVNLSADPNQEFFADGVTEEVTTALAHIGSIRVISRTSAMQFKGAKLGIPEIGRRLGVNGIVQGTVQRSEEIVRISAQLVDVATDRYLWTATFERQHRNVLALQNEIARAIAEQIHVRITPQAERRLASSRTVNPEAHDAYLRGKYHATRSYSPESLRRAMEEFRHAVDLDPSFAPGHAELAQCYALASNIMIPSSEAMPKARAAALRALEFDSTLAQAHAVLGYVRSFYDWDWDEGEKSFRRALALNPSEPNAHRDLGYSLAVRGRTEEAIAEMKESARVDPLSMTIAIFQLIPIYEGRRYADAVEDASRILASDSTMTHARFIRAQAYMGLGNPLLARSEIERCVREDSAHFYQAYLGYVTAKLGDLERAREIQRRLERKVSGGLNQPYGMAVLCLGMGDRKGAIRWLTKSVDTRAEESVFLKVDPVLDPLRSDPGFLALLRRVRLSV